MRQFFDSTEVELSWARILHSNKNFNIVFPETDTERSEILRDEEYMLQTKIFMAGHQTTVEYWDNRFEQRRKTKLVVGVSSSLIMTVCQYVFLILINMKFYI